PSPWNNIFKFLGILMLLFLIVGIFAPAPEGDCIAHIKIAGEITYDETGSILGGGVANTPEEISSLLDDAESDAKVKVILLEVNSPGGSAVASKEIFDRVRELGKPNMVYMTEVAASGGYYVSAASDYIIANPNTLTGSIGARGSFMNYEDLFSKLGLREEVIKSGALKDIGSGSRNLTEKEKIILQGLIDETFATFKKDVEAGRDGKINFGVYNEYLDARILTASQAKRAGLIDEIGGMKRVIEKANQMAGINVTDGSAPLPLCDFEPKGGLNLFTDLGSSFGKSIADGLMKGISEKQEVQLNYK
ncbi:MAG: signal peptide peptidase SppA, partial [Candidatus Micrarchaeota archaeon]